MSLKRGLVKRNKRSIQKLLIILGSPITRWQKLINYIKRTIVRIYRNKATIGFISFSIALMVRNHVDFLIGGGVYQLCTGICLFSFCVILPWFLFFLVVIQWDLNNTNSKILAVQLGLMAVVINISYLYFNLFLQYSVELSPPIIDNLPTLLPPMDVVFLPTQEVAPEIDNGWETYFKMWAFLLLGIFWHIYL